MVVKSGTSNKIISDGLLTTLTVNNNNTYLIKEEIVQKEANAGRTSF